MIPVKVIAVCLLITATAFAQGAPPALVKTAKVTEQNTAENSAFTGVLYFDRASSISTEVDGLVHEVRFREGDRVKAGDILINISTDFLDKDISLEKARIEQVSASIENKKKNLERYAKLLKSDAASAIDYDNIYFTHQELIKERESIRAGLSKIMLKKSKCAIKAPFDGLILEKSVEAGNWVTPGQTLCKLASSDDLFVKVSVAEKLARFVEKGDRVNVLINAYDEKLVGTVDGFLPMADEKTKNVSLKIRLGNLNAIKVPVAENMSASVFVPVSEKKVLKIIPRDALIKFQGKDFVYTIKDGKAAIVPVHIVSYTGNDVGVDDAHVKDGMDVVVDGNERLKPDQPVTVAGEEK